MKVGYIGCRSHYDLTKMKWWRDLKPSQLKSKWNHHKRPPSLLAPGVLHFPSHSSQNYYFHPQVKLCIARAGFFSTVPKKPKDEKTQNSSKKLKDSANIGVIYCKNQQKCPKNKGTIIPESRMNVPNITEWIHF